MVLVSMERPCYSGHKKQRFVSKNGITAEICRKTSGKKVDNLKCYKMAFMDYKSAFLVSLLVFIIWQCLETPQMIT